MPWLQGLTISMTRVMWFCPCQGELQWRFFIQFESKKNNFRFESLFKKAAGEIAGYRIHNYDTVLGC